MRKGLINSPPVVIVAFLLMGIGQPVMKQKRPADHQRMAGQSSAPTVESIAHPETEVGKAGPTKESKSVWEKTFAPELWPSWALVVVGIGGVWAALSTLGAIRRQTEHTARQADYLQRQIDIQQKRQTMDEYQWMAAASRRRQAG